MDKSMNCFKYFLSKGVDVDFLDKFGNSALFYAVMKDQTDMVEELLKLTKKIKYLNQEGKSIYQLVNPSNKNIK